MREQVEPLGVNHIDRQTKAIRVDAVKAVKLIIDSEWDGHQQAFHITVSFFFHFSVTYIQ